MTRRPGYLPLRAVRGGFAIAGLLILLWAAAIFVAAPASIDPLAAAYAESGGSGSGSGSSGGSGSGSSGSGSGSSGSSGSGDSGDSGSNSGSGGSGSGGDDTGEEGEEGSEVESSSSAGTAAQAGGREHMVADELVVVGDDEGFAAAVGQLGYQIIDRRPLRALGISVTRLRLPPHVQVVDARAALRAAFPGLVTDFHGLYTLHPQGMAVLPAPDYPRRLTGWGAVEEGCGRGVRIGLVDSPIDASLPALAGRGIVSRDFLDPEATPAPAEHGSALAAILIGGASPAMPAPSVTGLLPGAELYAAAVFERDSEGASVASVVAVAAAIDWLVGEGVPVINLSLSGPDNALMKLAVERAVERGAIPVAAVGNDGPDAPPAYPAAYDRVIAVTAVDGGQQVYDLANQGSHVDFAAPGVNVWAASAEGGAFYTGSSFAAPFVTAALAALRLEGEAGLAELESRLAAGALDLGDPGRDPTYGWGLIRMKPPCATLP